jgi:acylphosphatase
MKRVHCIISGDVVGVGYRAWARRLAQGLRLTGWIKNRDNKTVELVAEGEKQALEKFTASCKKGPDLAWVENIDITWLPASGEFFDFSVVY